MARSPLLGRRVHITGSIDRDSDLATADDVAKARELVTTLVGELVRLGANFVIPVDREPVREVDGLPVCFDWLVWQAARDNLPHRPSSAPGPFIVAVLHHKTEDQIPDAYAGLWDELRGTDLVNVENAAHWNMASKRMEAQANYGDILVALGGGEGALFLANLYHEAGKPIIPLDLPLCGENTGARRLFRLGLTSSQTRRLFSVDDDVSEHAWLNRLAFSRRHSIEERVSKVIALLEALDRPRAFAVRLLNPELDSFDDVQAFFDVVVRPVLEDEFGYRLIVIDGQQQYDHARIDEEIFAKLHRANVVIADLTGERPNCFLELGYALGRGLPTMVTVKGGAKMPFDIASLSALFWKAEGSVEERRRAFREHWNAIRNRPPLVTTEPLVS